MMIVLEFARRILANRQTYILAEEGDLCYPRYFTFYIPRETIRTPTQLARVPVSARWNCSPEPFSSKFDQADVCQFREQCRFRN